jgi:hypothetical protein
MACMVRVPTDVVKQRMQTSMYSSFLITITKTMGQVVLDFGLVGEELESKVEAWTVVFRLK